jgi:hypothetical protein
MANEVNPYAEDVKAGVSVIQINPIDVVERLGKHQFIYDYNAIPPLFWQNPALIHIKTPNSSGFFNFDGDGTGLTNSNPYTAYTVNPNAQVGIFSKGNIVNVVRFQGNNAIIENVNYKEPDPNVKKTVWGELLGGVVNKRELQVPKEYLRKVDDSFEPTILTGINYGANMKPQPVNTITSIGTQLGQLLETNVTYTIIKPFTFLKSYTNVRPLYELGGAGMLQYEQKANYDTLPIGIQVTGNLMSQMVSEKKSLSNMGVPPPPKYLQDVLVVNGMGQNGQLIIPVEYLAKKVTTNASTNNGTVVPVKNDNKNLLMIVGAFLLGLALFNNNSTKINN